MIAVSASEHVPHVFDLLVEGNQRYPPCEKLVPTNPFLLKTNFVVLIGGHIERDTNV